MTEEVPGTYSCLSILANGVRFILLRRTKPLDHESTKDANGTIMPAKGEAFNQTGVGLVGRWEGKASAARVEREVEVMRADALPLLNKSGGGSYKERIGSRERERCERHDNAS